jgi:nitrite reductase/ring-hydroxylating ferredoxin subunit
MSQGFLEGHIIECDFHAGCFDIRTGEIASPPCMVPMRTFKVVDDPANVVIELPSA